MEYMKGHTITVNSEVLVSHGDALQILQTAFMAWMPKQNKSGHGERFVLFKTKGLQLLDQSFVAQIQLLPTIS